MSSPTLLRIAPAALVALVGVPLLGWYGSSQESAAPAPAAVAAAEVQPSPALAAGAPALIAEIDRIVEDGVRRKVYPGAVVVIGRRDTVLHARGYGHHTWSSTSPVPTPDSTVWDVASMTKVMSSASIAARLAERGAVDLDAPVVRYLPAFAGGRRNAITVRMLLDHTSGLRSYLPLFQQTRTRDAALAALFREQPRRSPGDSAVYSDLNAIVLGLVLERAGGLPLDELFQQEVAAPLRLGQTRYRPPRSWHPRIAPTGIYRGTPMRGLVNDPNAAHLGGVAGHAGLFSTGYDVARFAQAWLHEGTTPDVTWLAPATVRRFLTLTPQSGTRMLGWDTRDTTLDAKGELSVFGRLVSRQTYGHTGWTGTKLWIDPANDLFLVFLTNRSFDPRTPESMPKLREVRADLSDATVRLVPGACAASVAAAPGAAPRC